MKEESTAGRHNSPSDDRSALVQSRHLLARILGGDGDDELSATLN